MQKIEAQVVELEAKLATVGAQLADPKVYADKPRIAELGREQATLQSRLDTAEADLLALYEDA